MGQSKHKAERGGSKRTGDGQKPVSACRVSVGPVGYGFVDFRPSSPPGDPPWPGDPPGDPRPQPLSRSLSSKLATSPIGIADRGYLTVIETQVVWLPVYFCPLHCPVNTPAPFISALCIALLTHLPRALAA